MRYRTVLTFTGTNPDTNGIVELGSMLLLETTREGSARIFEQGWLMGGPRALSFGQHEIYTAFQHSYLHLAPVITTVSVVAIP